MTLASKHTTLDFVIRCWAAWTQSKNEPASQAKQAAELLAKIPSQLKRRFSPLAKAVYCAIAQCQLEQHNLPVVFSSAHGELAKSLALIQTSEAGEAISPTTFSLSVHNAIAGLYSMAFANTAEITVLAPGEIGIAAAFIEACGLLQEGTREVLVVFYDDPLPAFYPAEPYQLSSDESYALALVISQAGDGLALQFWQDQHAGYGGEQALQLPQLLAFLSGSNHDLQLNTPRQSWHWQKCSSCPV